MRTSSRLPRGLQGASQTAARRGALRKVKLNSGTPVWPHPSAVTEGSGTPRRGLRPRPGTGAESRSCSLNTPRQAAAGSGSRRAGVTPPPEPGAARPGAAAAPRALGLIQRFASSAPRRRPGPPPPPEAGNRAPRARQVEGPPGTRGGVGCGWGLTFPRRAKAAAACPGAEVTLPGGPPPDYASQRSRRERARPGLAGGSHPATAPPAHAARPPAAGRRRHRCATARTRSRRGGGGEFHDPAFREPKCFQGALSHSRVLPPGPGASKAAFRQRMSLCGSSRQFPNLRLGAGSARLPLSLG